MPAGKGKKKDGLSGIKAFLIAPLIFIIVLGGMFAYSGIWPPLVVVESKSMQHDPNHTTIGNSHIGTIDTGDIVIVKKVANISDVQTYVQGMVTGYKTYGEYGDVIIYYHQGMSEPIIHRAIVDLVYNYSGGGFDVPSLAEIPKSDWSVPGGQQVWWDLKGSLDLYNIGYMNATVLIDLSAMLTYMESTGQVHGGIITMGDNNWEVGPNGTIIGLIDQGSIPLVMEPVPGSWIIGVARGEILGSGYLKLWATGTAPSYTPVNSEIDLLVTVGLIIGIPVSFDMINTMLKKRGIEPFRSWRRSWKGKDDKDEDEETPRSSKK